VYVGARTGESGIGDEAGANIHVGKGAQGQKAQEE